MPLPTAGDLPHPGTEPTSLTSLALAGGFFTTSPTWAVLGVLSFQRYKLMYLHPPRGGACSNLFKDVLKMNKAPAILLESEGNE